MAWTTPRTWVAGELLTAALLNTHLRDNDAALRGGGIAIASQAALDLITGASATALARTAAGAALQSPRINAAGNAWEFTTPPLALYATTLADCNNTAAETAICSVTVPVAISNGDVIEVQFGSLVKQNSGGGIALALKFYIGANSVQIANIATNGTSATERTSLTRFLCQRIGSDLWVASYGTMSPDPYNKWSTFSYYPLDSPIAGPAFTAGQTISIKAQWGAADATAYIKPQRGLAWHLKS